MAQQQASNLQVCYDGGFDAEEPNDLDHGQWEGVKVPPSTLLSKT